jgi:hypothetical protein
MNLFKRVPRWLLIATIGIVPVVIALVNSLRGGAILVGDRAVFALLVKDAATGSFPSVGQYSWHGWNHPGALIFYVFAPFHWLSGGAAWGLFVGVAVYSCALLVAISWLGYRLRGIWGSALGVAALLAYWVSVGRIASVDAWTPYLALPLFILFLLAVLGVTERDRPSMWMMWISGAIAVQVHVGYLPIVGLVGLVACIVFWWTGGNQRSITRPLATSILLFVPYVFDLRQSVRNVGDLARYFVTANEPTIGFSRALEVMSFEMSPQATWLAGPSEVGLIGEAPSSSLIWFIALVVCLCAATVWVWRSSEGSLRRRFLNSAPVVWALLVAGTIAVAPSASINPEGKFPSLFEPVHGSAPDIYGKKIANPIGQIWSAALMLNHLGYPEAGQAVFNAIEKVLSAGPGHAPLTPDIGGKASTEDLGKAIAAAI